MKCPSCGSGNTYPDFYYPSLRKCGVCNLTAPHEKYQSSVHNSEVRGMTNFYIVRCHGGEWSHFFPPKNGVPPDSFLTQELAEQTIKDMSYFGLDMKVIPKSDFSKYPVPRRY